ncbi:MAG: M24 family metallopeptidase [Rhizobiales bacterium]|nr:M24 family metallopeptidase [Hyphomicrobiales bacterium]
MPFQSFDVSARPETSAPRVAALRCVMQIANIDGFIVPRGDEYLGEYVPASAERLAWLTSFTGSAGTAVVLTERAGLFVDGRYTAQAAAQVDLDLFEIIKVPEVRLATWIADHAPTGGRIGYDPALHPLAMIEGLEKALGKRGLTLVPIEQNPIDGLWSDRPAPPKEPVRLHPIERAGRSAREKLDALAGELSAAGQDAALVSHSDAVAWLFNIRGGDIARIPVALAMALVHRDGTAVLAIAREKLSGEVAATLSSLARIVEPADFAGVLAEAGRRGLKVRISGEATPAASARVIVSAGGTIEEGVDLVARGRAIKTPAEIAGIRRAHVRDGIAMTRFLAWLDRTAPLGGLDEIAAARALEGYREATDELADLSFDTISGSGPNGAIVHYRVTSATNRTLVPGELYLVDSGGQYLDGTTDITRTVAVGQPTTDMRRHFTLVLKGHIAIATTRFPPGTRGVDIDAFARRALWQAGLDYEHGTGHGVGSYLSVHEGPPGISKRNTSTLEAGMLVSNEPGYYREGHYGIRIENLVLVRPAEPIEGGDRPMHGFETVTLAPIDRQLVEGALLTAEERAWLDAYHARVRDTLCPHLDAETRTFLEQATAPIG